MPLFIMLVALWEFEGAGLLLDAHAESKDAAVKKISEVCALDSE